jgi:hypothetical protein
VAAPAVGGRTLLHQHGLFQWAGTACDESQLPQ